MTRPIDFPFDDVCRKAAEITREGQFIALQKFTCQHCGQRLTINTPNEFHVEGSCDRCGKITDIRARGCNYVLIANTPKARDILRKLQ